MAIHHFRHSGVGASSSDFNDRALMQCDNDKLSPQSAWCCFTTTFVEPKVPSADG